MIVRKIIILITFATLLVACNNDKKDTVKQDKKEELVQVKNGKYTEWYPGKKQIKFEGMIDKKGQRNGKWSYYSEKGTELSFTLYEHGVKEGFTVVKYPNGAIHYRGEYLHNQIVGLWTTYDANGKKITEKDYGYPAE
jgi:antitoxin component YwqK of YwqJK toxin-antitoxin module